MTTHSRPKPRVGVAIWVALAVAAIGVSVFVRWAGADYFALPPGERVWNSAHKIFGASGELGHTLGIVGSGLMLANLLYLLRRRWSRLAWLGSIPTWLAFHVAAGIGGGSLVLVHTTGRLHNPVATCSTIAALVVLVTGIVGRWIYGQVPHRPDGAEAEEGELIGQLRAAIAQVGEDLRDVAQDTERSLARALPPTITNARAAILSLPKAPITFWRMASAQRQVRRELALDLDSADVKTVLHAAKSAVSLRRRARRQAGFKRLVGTWRGMHRIATFVLILSLVAHVITILYVGVM